MRNALAFLAVIGAAILAIAVLLPVLGAIFVAVAVLLALIISLLLLAPLLVKLPWFRRRIIVERYGNARTIRFGSGAFSTSQPPSGQPGDVIDVEAREVPDNE